MKLGLVPINFDLARGALKLHRAYLRKKGTEISYVKVNYLLK